MDNIDTKKDYSVFNSCSMGLVYNNLMLEAFG